MDFLNFIHIINLWILWTQTRRLECINFVVFSYTNRTFKQHTPPSANTKHGGMAAVFTVLHQPLTALESMTDITSSQCPGYQKLDELASSSLIPALRQFAPIWCWSGTIIFVLPHSLTCCSLWCWSLLCVGAAPARQNESVLQTDKHLVYSQKYFNWHKSAEFSL